MNSRERFKRAAGCEGCDRPPVWLMRQAGRYLPEYRELRSKYEFLEMVKRPELAVEVSLQPWKRFGMDAVILFSDILVPIVPMGVKLSFEEGRGPVLDRRIECLSDVEKLARPSIRNALSFTFEALEELRHRLGDEAALIGFVGSPWTLACYMVEGGSGEFAGALKMADEDGEAMEKLLDLLTEVLSEYAVKQARAGCDAVQIFDTWGGLLESEEYEKLVLPRVTSICRAVADAGAVPILFVRDSERMLSVMRGSGARVISLGSRTSVSEARKILGRGIATQGNLDPEKLLLSPAAVVEETRKLLDETGALPGHIMNLGHGVLPRTRTDCVKAFVDTVRKCR